MYILVDGLGITFTFTFTYCNALPGPSRHLFSRNPLAQTFFSFRLWMMINKSFQTFRNACDTSTETFGKLESLYNLAVSPPKRPIPCPYPPKVHQNWFILFLLLKQLKSEQKTLSESQRNDFEIVFSQKIIAFYETIPDVALTFVASFITEFFKRRFSVHAKKKNNGCYMSTLLLEPWEHVLRVIVIGLEVYTSLFAICTILMACQDILSVASAK